MNHIDLLEKQFRTIIIEVGLKDAVTALHNSLVHGEILPFVTDKQLSDLFDILDKMIVLSKEISG